jgi:hypothetical protein
MFIAHLPSGYIVARVLFKKLNNVPYSRSWFIFFCMFGAIAPDLDLIYFYLWDQRAHHHHSYWSHYPIIWFGLLFSMGFLQKFFSVKNVMLYVLGFLLCGCLHLLLDSVVGDIWWGAPFIDQPFALATVPAVFSPWWLNFIVHWSFLLEILITGWAVYLWYKKRNALYQQ